jgi:hypothetical protein
MYINKVKKKPFSYVTKKKDNLKEKQKVSVKKEKEK